MDKKLKILHVEDVPSDAVMIAKALKKGGLNFESLVVDTKDKFIEALREYCPDLILCDHSLPSFDSIEALAIFHATRLKIPFILITATMPDMFAVDIIKKGADDYILKDRLSRLPVAINNALEKFQLQKEREILLEEVIKNEKHFRALVENSADAVVILNEAGKPTYTSPSIHRILGYTETEAMKLDLYQILHPDNLQGVREKMAECLSNPGLPLTDNANRFKHKNGTWIWVEATITNMLHNPVINGIVTNFRDITERKRTEQQFREMASQLEQERSKLIEAQSVAKLGSWETEIPGMNVTWSDETYRIFETDFGSFLPTHQKFLDFIHPEDITKVNAAFNDSLNKNSIFTIEHRIITADGNTKFVIEHWRVFQDDHGLPVRAIGTCQDITDRKKTEEALTKSEANLKAIFENTSDGIILTDIDGSVKLFNSHIKDFHLMHSGREIVTGNNILDFVHESRQQNYRDQISKVMTGITVRYDHSYEMEKDKIQWFSFTLNPVYNQDKIEGVCITAIDITERKESENSLKQSEFRYRQIVETAQEGIWMIDEFNKTTFVNEKLCEIFGYSKDEMLGKEIYYFMDEEGKQIAAKLMQDKRRGEKGRNDFKYISKSGKEIWTSISTNPITDDKGNYKGALAMVADITEKVLLDAKLLEDEKKYRSLAHQLEMKNKDLRQFTYIVSHNLRAPIAKIQGLVFLINHDAESKAMLPQLLQMISSEVEQLDNVVKDINGILSVQDSGDKKLEHVLFDLKLKLIENVLENQIVESNAVITADFHEVEGLITVKSYLYSIMYNLLSNAIKYRSPERQLLIQLKTTRKDDMIVFFVKDNGRGINMEKNGHKIFGLYKRFHGGQIAGWKIHAN